MGWRLTFVALGATGMVWVVFWRALYSDRPAPGTVAALHSGVPWAELLRQRQLWFIFAMYFFQAWGTTFYFGWFPTYLVKGEGFTEGEMGVFSALPFVCGAFGNLAGGYLSDRLAARFGLKIGRRLVGSAGLAMSALLLAGMTMTHDKATVVVLSSLGFGVADLMLPAAWAVCLDVGHEYAGVVTGTMNTAGQLGGFVCSVLFGYLIAAWGSYREPLWLVAASVLLGAFLFTRIDPTRQLVSAEARLEAH